MSVPPEQIHVTWSQLVRTLSVVTLVVVAKVSSEMASHVRTRMSVLLATAAMLKLRVAILMVPLFVPVMMVSKEMENHAMILMNALNLVSAVLTLAAQTNKGLTSASVFLDSKKSTTNAST